MPAICGVVLYQGEPRGSPFLCLQFVVLCCPTALFSALCKPPETSFLSAGCTSRLAGLTAYAKISSHRTTRNQFSVGGLHLAGRCFRSKLCTAYGFLFGVARGFCTFICVSVRRYLRSRGSRMGDVTKRVTFVPSCNFFKMSILLHNVISVYFGLLGFYYFLPILTYSIFIN